MHPEGLRSEDTLVDYNRFILIFKCKKGSGTGRASFLKCGNGNLEADAADLLWLQPGIVNG